MTLLSLIRKREPVGIAAATFSTHQGETAENRPIVTAVAVVNSQTVQAANDDTDPAENFACFAWLIHFADREPVKVTFSPMATHAAALACYPDALAAEPIPDTPSRTPTAEESAHLTMLMTAIYGDDSEDDRTDALHTALADPDNALTCYTAIASELGLPLPDDDDRRTCRQCANLRGGVCVVACPGGAVSANRGYRPGALVFEQPHRCEAFKTRPDCSL